MYKKMIFILLGILFIAGCSYKEKKYDVNTIHYDLHISNYYQEKIVFTFPSNAYELAKENQNVDYDSLEYILLVDNFSRPIHNNLYTLYGKNIMRLNDAIEVDLDFDYLEKDFVDSNYINTCFENHSVMDEQDYLSIHLSGKFYCLQDKVMTIHVSSDYSNEETNGIKANDAYEWTIDSNNVNNVNIFYKVYRNKDQMATYYGKIKQQKQDNNLVATVEFLIILLVIVFGFFFYKILYQRQEFQEDDMQMRKRKKR